MDSSDHKGDKLSSLHSSSSSSSSSESEDEKSKEWKKEHKTLKKLMKKHHGNIRQLPPIYDDLVIIVQGQIPDDAQRFSVNLCTGSALEHCDRALHVNPRYNEGNVVVRNSLLSGKWGVEERSGPAFSIPKGSSIECILLIQHDVIKVAFNGQHYCDYRHRTPKERISHIALCGDMKLKKLWFYDTHAGMHGFRGRSCCNVYPLIDASTTGPLPFPPSIGYYHPAHGANLSLPSGYPVPGHGQHVGPRATPVRHLIPGDLFPGRMIFITGTAGSTKFAVNLRCREHDGDIAFQFNARLAEGVVVRNSLIGGSWGHEERDQPSFPFHPGQKFSIIILCDVNGYKVAVNNRHFIEYKARLGNLQSVHWVEVAFDTTVESIFVI